MSLTPWKRNNSSFPSGRVACTPPPPVSTVQYISNLCYPSQADIGDLHAPNVEAPQLRGREGGPLEAHEAKRRQLGAPVDVERAQDPSGRQQSEKTCATHSISFHFWQNMYVCKRLRLYIFRSTYELIVSMSEGGPSAAQSHRCMSFVVCINSLHRYTYHGPHPGRHLGLNVLYVFLRTNVVVVAEIDNISTILRRITLFACWFNICLGVDHVVRSDARECPGVHIWATETTTSGRG